MYSLRQEYQSSQWLRSRHVKLGKLLTAAAAVDVQLSYYDRDRSLWKGAIFPCRIFLDGISVLKWRRKNPQFFCMCWIDCKIWSVRLTCFGATLYSAFYRPHPLIRGWNVFQKIRHLLRYSTKKKKSNWRSHVKEGWGLGREVHKKLRQVVVIMDYWVHLFRVNPYQLHFFFYHGLQPFTRNL